VQHEQASVLAEVFRSRSRRPLDSRLAQFLLGQRVQFARTSQRYRQISKPFAAVTPHSVRTMAAAATEIRASRRLPPVPPGGRFWAGGANENRIGRTLSDESLTSDEQYQRLSSSGGRQLSNPVHFDPKSSNLPMNLTRLEHLTRVQGWLQFKSIPGAAGHDNDGEASLDASSLHVSLRAGILLNCSHLGLGSSVQGRVKFMGRLSFSGRSGSGCAMLSSAGLEEPLILLVRGQAFIA